MGKTGIEAELVPLALANTAPRFEVQLLRDHHPEPIRDGGMARFDKRGLNHVCFAVEADEVRKLTASASSEYQPVRKAPALRLLQ